MAGRSEAFERFMASTDIDYDKWHDGEGYDLDALRSLQGGERDTAEAWLLVRSHQDWRDLEGLVALGTAQARAAVVEQLRNGVLVQRLSAARLLPRVEEPAIEADRVAAILAGLREATVMHGLSYALDLAHAYRDAPGVMDGLFRAALREDREVAMHAAALLAYLHGNAKEDFDWDRRPFFLRFAHDDRAVREGAFRELCAECGVDPGPYLRT